MNSNITLTNFYVRRDAYCVKLDIYASRLTPHASNYKREVSHG